MWPPLPLKLPRTLPAAAMMACLARAGCLPPLGLRRTSLLLLSGFKVLRSPLQRWTSYGVSSGAPQNRFLLPSTTAWVRLRRPLLAERWFLPPSVPGSGAFLPASVATWWPSTFWSPHIWLLSMGSWRSPVCSLMHTDVSWCTRRSIIMVDVQLRGHGDGSRLLVAQQAIREFLRRLALEKQLCDFKAVLRRIAG